MRSKVTISVNLGKKTSLGILNTLILSPDVLYSKVKQVLIRRKESVELSKGFHKNSLVLTPKGLNQIQWIQKGDYVLNKDGQFIEVALNRKSFNKLIYVKGHGHPKLGITRGKDIFATNYERVWNKEREVSERKFKKIKWVEAEEMKGMFWSSPIKFPRRKPPIRLNKDIVWLIGAYLGIGNINFKKGVHIKTNDFRYKKLKEVLDNLNIRYKKNRIEAYIEYFINHAVLVDWIKRSFHGNFNVKILPFWLYGMEQSLRRELFEGYIWARGVFEHEQYRFSTRNKHLAMGMKLIAQSLGLSVAMYVSANRKKKKIIQRWQIVAEINARSSAIVEGKRVGLVRKIIKGKKRLPVYNLRLKNGCSYILDGLIVKS